MMSEVYDENDDDGDDDENDAAYFLGPKRYFNFFETLNTVSPWIKCIPISGLWRHVFKFEKKFDLKFEIYGFLVEIPNRYSAYFFKFKISGFPAGKALSALFRCAIHTSYLFFGVPRQP